MAIRSPNRLRRSSIFSRLKSVGLTPCSTSSHRRSGDSSQRPGARGVRGSECFAAVMLEIIEIYFIPAMLLQTLQGEEIGPLLGDITAYEMPDPAQFIEGHPGLTGTMICTPVAPEVLGTESSPSDLSTSPTTAAASIIRGSTSSEGSRSIIHSQGSVLPA